MESQALQAPLEAGTKEEIFTTIVNAHLDEIYSFARYMISEQDDANDIVQKTFLSLFNNMDKLDLDAPIKPWLFRVARNHCLDYIKKKKPMRFSELEEDNQVFEIPNDDPALEHQLDDVLFNERFKGYVQELPEAMKEVLLLKYFEDLTFEQIAQMQGLSINTVKSHFYRGKQKLYTLIKATQN